VKKKFILKFEHFGKCIPEMYLQALIFRYLNTPLEFRALDPGVDGLKHLQLTPKLFHW